MTKATIAGDSIIDPSPLLKKVMHLAERAGEILKRYHRTDIKVDYKKDQFDPVSTADRESDAFLRRGIADLFPNDQILSEENSLRPDSYAGRVWMIDPLDDTKGYLAGRDTAGVMIGLLDRGRPQLGIVFLPFRGVWYYAEAGRGSYRVKDGQAQRLRVRSVTTIPAARLVGRYTVPGDERPIDQLVAQLPFRAVIPEGCIGAKVGLIAAGEAEAFIHTNTKAGKWDTLAAELILSEAGGAMCDIDGRPLDYTKTDSGWDRYFLAACTPALLQEMVERLQTANASSHIF